MGKGKGGAYERDIATTSYKKGESAVKMTGDIMPVDLLVEPFDKLAIECKAYKSIDLWGIVTGKGNLVKFWKQAVKQAEQANKYPVLIVKENRRAELFIISWKMQSEISAWLNIMPSIEVRCLDYNWFCIYLLRDILEIDPKVFLNMLRGK